MHVGSCETGARIRRCVRGEREREKLCIGVCGYETKRIISQCVDAT